MGRNASKTSPVAHVLRLAAAQHGAIRADQTRKVGLSADQLTRMVDHGLLRRRRRGLYVSTAVANDHRQEAMLAVLAAPVRVVTSHETALFLHGLGPSPSQVHVTVDPGVRLRVANVVAHRSPVPPNHRARIGPLPVTTLNRTLVDLASVTDLDGLAAVLDPLVSEGRVQPDRLLATVDDIVLAPGRHGTLLLRTALQVWTDQIEPGSPAEARLLRLLRERGHAEHHTQIRVDVDGRSFYVDVGWPDDRVGLEYAGRLAHGPRRWRSDEDRAELLERAGWALREVDVSVLLPGRSELWEWLDRRLGHRAG